MYLDQFRQRLIKLGHLSLSDLRPCTIAEVEAAEARLQLHFPGSYREFLLLMGHGAGQFLAGSDCFYDNLFDIQTWARETLADNGVERELPTDAFVFFMHQGYQFLFLRTTEGDDPPAYYYNEGLPETALLPRRYEHFSDFLIGELEADANATRRFEER